MLVQLPLANGGRFATTTKNLGLSDEAAVALYNNKLGECQTALVWSTVKQAADQLLELTPAGNC